MVYNEELDKRFLMVGKELLNCQTLLEKNHVSGGTVILRDVMGQYCSHLVTQQ